MAVRRTLSPIRFPVFASALLLPACFSLPTLPTGPRVVADFDEDGGVVDGAIEPTWSLFSPWTCSARAVRDPDNSDAGQDAGSDGGVDPAQTTSPDGGPGVSCTLGPGDGDQHALAASFDLDAPIGQRLNVVVATHAVSMPADLTGFTTLVFDARLDSESLPIGTQLKVELGCRANARDPFVDQRPIIAAGANWNPFPLPLEMFLDARSSRSEACLAVVDSISFILQLGTATTGNAITGTLRLDDIELK